MTDEEIIMLAKNGQFDAVMTFLFDNDRRENSLDLREKNIGTFLKNGNHNQLLYFLRAAAVNEDQLKLFATLANETAMQAFAEFDDTEIIKVFAKYAGADQIRLFLKHATPKQHAIFKKNAKETQAVGFADMFPKAANEAAIKSFLSTATDEQIEHFSVNAGDEQVKYFVQNASDKQRIVFVMSAGNKQMERVDILRAEADLIAISEKETRDKEAEEWAKTANEEGVDSFLLKATTPQIERFCKHAGNQQVYYFSKYASDVQMKSFADHADSRQIIALIKNSASKNVEQFLKVINNVTHERQVFILGLILTSRELKLSRDRNIGFLAQLANPDLTEIFKQVANNEQIKVFTDSLLERETQIFLKSANNENIEYYLKNASDDQVKSFLKNSDEKQVKVFIEHAGENQMSSFANHATDEQIKSLIKIADNDALKKFLEVIISVDSQKQDNIMQLFVIGTKVFEHERNITIFSQVADANLIKIFVTKATPKQIEVFAKNATPKQIEVFAKSATPEQIEVFAKNATPEQAATFSKFANQANKLIFFQNRAIQSTATVLTGDVVKVIPLADLNQAPQSRSSSDGSSVGPASSSSFGNESNSEMRATQEIEDHRDIILMQMRAAIGDFRGSEDVREKLVNIYLELGQQKDVAGMDKKTLEFVNAQLPLTQAEIKHKNGVILVMNSTITAIKLRQPSADKIKTLESLRDQYMNSTSNLHGKEDAFQIAANEKRGALSAKSGAYFKEELSKLRATKVEVGKGNDDDDKVQPSLKNPGQ